MQAHRRRQGARGAYHVSSGSDFSIKELFDATIAALEHRRSTADVEVRPRGADDASTILLDPSQTEARLRLDASATPLEEGVAARDRLLPRVRHRRRRTPT